MEIKYAIDQLRPDSLSTAEIHWMPVFKLLNTAQVNTMLAIWSRLEHWTYCSWQPTYMSIR